MANLARPDSSERSNRRDAAERRASDERRINLDWRQAAVEKYGAEGNVLAERAWAAGFFDGEGTISGAQGSGITASIEQTVTGEKKSYEKDIEHSIKGLLILERFKSAVGGVGKIVPRPHRKRGEEQPTCVWKCSSQKDLQTVWDALGEFLSLEKRDQFAAALSIPIITALKLGKPLPEGSTEVEVTRPKARKGRAD